MGHYPFAEQPDESRRSRTGPKRRSSEQSRRPDGPHVALAGGRNTMLGGRGHDGRDKDALGRWRDIFGPALDLTQVRESPEFELKKHWIGETVLRQNRTTHFSHDFGNEYL